MFVLNRRIALPLSFFFNVYSFVNCDFTDVL